MISTNKGFCNRKDFFKKKEELKLNLYWSNNLIVTFLDAPAMQDSISRIHALFSVIVNRGLKMLNETSKK
jgi:hypothetical protein